MLFRDITLIDENFKAQEHQNLLTEEDRITYIGTALPQKYDGPVYDGHNRLAMPGLFNIHCHIPMTLLRGYGEGLPLQRWLTERVFPFEALLTEDDVYWGALLGCAELLRSGCVSFTDMYMHPKSVSLAVMGSGIKANLSNGSLSFDASAHYVPGNSNCDEMNDFLALLSKAERPDGRVRADASLHAEYTSHESYVREVAAYAQEHKLRMHVHVSETQSEHEECKARHGGLTPAAYLERCGLFDVPTTAAHCVWAEEADFDIFAKRGVTVATCPSSNLKLGSGIAPLKGLLARGVRVGIGTDGASSNNNLNMLEEATLCSLLHKGVNRDPMLLPPAEALRMACQNGALSQGREDCGCLKVGNRADIAVLRLDTPHMQPVHDAAANVLYSAGADDVCLTMVDGEVMYRDGAYANIDVERVLFEVRRIRDEKLALLAAQR